MNKETPRSAFNIGLENFTAKLNGYANGRYCGTKEFIDLQNTVNQYLLGGLPEDKKEIASLCFLSSIKDALSSHWISTKALALLQYSYKKMSLKDTEKQLFLDIMLGTPNKKNNNFNYLLKYSRDCYHYFSNYKTENKNALTKDDKIFAKIEKVLNRKDLSSKDLSSKDYLDCASRFYPFLQNYSKQASPVNHDLIMRYSQVMFNIQNNCSAYNVSFWPLCNLLTRSEELKSMPKMHSMFDDSKPFIDKVGLNKVLQNYNNFINNKEELNYPLHNKVCQMMSYVVQNFDYQPAEVMSLRKQLHTANVSKPLKKYMRELGDDLVKDYARSISKNTSRQTVQAQSIISYER